MSCQELAGALVLFAGVFAPGVVVGVLGASLWPRREHRERSKG